VLNYSIVQVKEKLLLSTNETVERGYHTLRSRIIDDRWQELIDVRALAIVPLICLTVVTAFAGPVVLAKAGKPAATIVIPKEANSREILAARELRHYVEAICGVELPLNEDAKKVAGTGFYIGGCEPTTEADFPAEDLNPETYAIRVREGSVFFTGRHPTPTYFAVISFIEDALGVRWFAPGEEWEHVPDGQAAEEVVKVPDTSPRVWSGNQARVNLELYSPEAKLAPGESITIEQIYEGVRPASGLFRPISCESM